MTFFIYMIIAIVGSSLVSAVSLHIGAAFVGFVLGKGDSLDSRAINGELLHIMLKNLGTFPPESQKWWTALLTPTLRERQVLEFSAQEVIAHLSAFTRYDLDPIIRSNVMNTLDLLKKVTSKVKVMHWDFYQESMGSRQTEPG